MTDEKPPATPGTIGGFDPAEYISKFGLPTVILLIVGYVGYNEVLHQSQNGTHNFWRK